MLVTTLIVTIASIQACDAAKILGIVPFPSYSHQVVFQPLWKELSLRGHQVTTITTDPINDPSLTNLTEIDIHFSYVQWNKIVMENTLTFNDNIFWTMIQWWQHLFSITDEQLSYKNVQALLNSDKKFDLLILEPYAYSMFAFAERFQCPVIAIMSLDGIDSMYQMMGNPTHPVLYPNIILPYDAHITFTQRLYSVLLAQTQNLLEYYAHRLQNQLIKKHFGEHYPSAIDIMMNTSLLFVNSDPIYHKIRPLVPAVIQIGGGSHLKPPKPLPHDLQKVLDDAKNGFIYFSLGSNVKSKDLPMGTRATISKTFSELPYMVLWKYEGESLPDKPNNVIISKWLPQHDVLRHPNIKLFITQGGLQSSEETIQTGIPIVGMPFFGDHGANVKRLVDKGLGLSIDYTTLTKEGFKEAILKVIENPKYRKRALELGALVRDQPMTGLERAVWWTEYVLRHKGARHLRSPLLDIPWYQYLLLDVCAVLLVSLSLTLYILCKLIKLIYRFVKPKPNNYEKKIK